MTKRELADSMRAFNGHAEFITRIDLARFMGIKNPRNVDKYLVGLDRVNGKYYMISDVSSRIMNTMDIR